MLALGRARGIELALLAEDEVRALGVAAAVLVTRGGTDSQLPEDGPWSNSLTVPAKGPKPYDAPWSNSLNLIPPTAVDVSGFDALSGPGSNSLNLTDG